MAISNRTATTANSGAGASTTVVLNFPTNTTLGDYCQATISVDTGSSITITPPAGWTLLNRTNNTTVLGQAVYWKIYAPSDGSSATWTVTSCNNSGVMNTYTGVDKTNPISSFVALGKTSASTSGTFSAVTPQTETVYAVLCLTSRNTTGTTTITTASSGYTTNGDTCTTASAFIETAIEDQHATFGVPIAAFTPGNTTYSRSVTDVDLAVLLRPDLTSPGGAAIETMVSAAGNGVNSQVLPTLNSGYLATWFVGIDNSNSSVNVNTITGGPTFTKVTSDTKGANGTVELWKAVNVAPQNTVLTVNMTGSAFPQITIWACSVYGLNTDSVFQDDAQNNGSGGAASITKAVTTIADKDFIIFAGGASNNSTLTAGTNCTLVFTKVNAGSFSVVGLLRYSGSTSPAGSYTCAMNNTVTGPVGITCGAYRFFYETNKFISDAENSGIGGNTIAPIRSSNY